ncbi:MAG: DUF58 domain-containing protein [Dehalococcoidia bacterium]
MHGVRHFHIQRSVLIIVLLLALCVTFALATGFWLLFRLAYVLLAAVPLCFLWARINISRLEVTVQRPVDRAQVGQTSDERITVRNRGMFPKVWLEVDDPSTLPGYHAGRVITLGGKMHRSWRSQTLLTRRGVYSVGPLTVTSGDPFGLFRMVRRYGEQTSIMVYPPFFDLPHFTVPPANLPGEGRFRKRTHYVTPNASGVRDYAPGDSFNRIHWRSTARANKLMVKTFELDPASDIWIALDLHAAVQAGSGDESTEEYAVKVAASVARHFLNQNRNVGLLTFGERLEIVEVERSGQQLTRLLEALAIARADGDVPIGDLINVEGRRFGRHTTLIVITPSVDEAWVLSLMQLTQRGVKVAVVLIEASTFGGRGNPLLVVGSLAAADIWTYLVKRGDNLSSSLAPAGEESATPAPALDD